MTVNHSKAKAYERRLRLCDGRRTVFVFADDLVQICGLTRTHANRIIRGTSELKPVYERLLRHELLSYLPGFPPEWYVDDGDIVTPTGYRINDSMLEQFSFSLSIVSDMSRDIKRLIQENKLLQDKVSEPREIRVYSNSETEPDRVIRLVK